MRNKRLLWIAGVLGTTLAITGQEGEKKSPVNGLGRRHRLPHHCKNRICFGAACDPRFFSRLPGYEIPHSAATD